ncbi:MAG: LacI family DNA-binding transcriptional regulator [Planktomarina sp.]
MARSSLAELSEQLGLSKPTISRALNDYPDISDATKRRVKKAAAELGYTASTAAVRLQRGTSDTIGLVMEPDTTGLQAMFHAELTTALSAALAVEDKDLLFHSALEQKDEGATYLRLARSGKVDGFIVLRTRLNDSRIEALSKENIPFITLGRTDMGVDHVWYDVDGRAAFAQATNHLIELGHTRIAHVMGPKSTFSAKVRFDGYTQAMQAAGLDVDPSLTWRGDYSAQSGRHAFDAFWAMKAPPTAILCANDAMAIGVLAQAQVADVHVPQQLSVIGYDGVSIGQHTTPPLTTMRHSPVKAGRAMAGHILALVKGDIPSDHQTLVAAEFMKRGSTAPPPEVNT